ncbi:mitochondrial ribonuclease p protein 3 [Plakobranchus ocellatus]|uniref:ribonuclease P n=1 Tax=Plakobranchus ocellatus TaxID=259542 RepID=A0AAV3ZGN1_9GAST|nr:mitochondrial ribonuclease p protein 3 [Plakobranchus ocellatus]
MLISKVLRSGCSWSQLLYTLTKRNASLSALNSVSTCCTIVQQQSRLPYGLPIQCMHKAQYCLQNVRYLASSSSSDSNANLKEEDTQIQSPVGGVAINRNRRDWQVSFRDFIASRQSPQWQIEDWDYVAEKMPLPNGPSWEVLCMHTLYQDKSLALGHSLMKYLELKGKSPSHITSTFFVGLLGATSASSDQDDETKAFFDRLLSQTDVLDPASIEVLCHGLSHTKYYKECMKLAQMCKETSNVSPSVLMNMLIASVRFKDLAFCESTLAMLEEENVEPTQMASFIPKVIEVYLSSSSEQACAAVMDFCRKHSLLLPLRRTEDVIDAFYRLQPDKWRIQASYVHHRTGRCVNCQHQMEKIEVTDAEFEALQQAFLKQVIVGSNIFYKSTPEEVSHFVKFVEKTGPYDVVIDGLNVLHRQKRPKQPDVLYKAVRHFHDQGKKVLLLGTKVLTRNISAFKNFSPRPIIYMTSTTKADDSFFLYAALQSGKDTLIVSQDKLRDHKFLMDPKLRHLFQQWLKTVQIYDWFYSRYGEFTIGRRHLHSIGPTRDEAGWHIPLNDIDKDYPFGHAKVLCVRDVTVATKIITKSDNSNRRPLSADGITNDRKRPRINYGKKKPANNKSVQQPEQINLDELMQ